MCNPDVLFWLLKDIPRKLAGEFVHRLLNWDSDAVFHYTSRAGGGFIPDPRIVGVVKIVDVVEAAMDGDRKGVVERWRAEVENRRLGVDSSKTVKELVEILIEKLKVCGKRERDDLFEIYFPFRSKGDKSIRRTRFSDLYTCTGGAVDEFLVTLFGYDWTRAMIVMWYAVTQPSWWVNMKSVLQSTIADFDVMATYISDKLKSSNSEDGWQTYAENKCLTGYRLLPWPGYDAEADTVALANGGTEKHMYESFDYWVSRALKIDVTSQKVEWMTFRQFVESGLWITQGASSVGRLEVDYRGEKFNVKCRKNMLIDVLTYDEIIERCNASTEMISTAFTKNELGKIRIAVCSDLETYLWMAWIVYVSGSGYKNWTGTTRSENAQEKMKRMKSFIEQCRTMFGMAWDYKGFERQVKTSELRSIFSQIVKAARLNVPPNALVDWDLLTTSLDERFEHSFIISTTGVRLHVEGGLPSGLFVTSICGDGFNLTCCESVQGLMQDIGIPKIPTESLKLQGDDTAVFHKRVGVLQIFDWLLTKIGVVGGDGKFGIVEGANEFLRVSFSKKGAFGYAARAVAGIVQRKPWSDSPYDPTDSIRSAIDAFLIIQRRGAFVSDFGDRMLRIWCRINKISYIVARTSKTNGGLGIGTPIYDCVVEGVPKVTLELTANVKTNTRTDSWVDYMNTKIGHAPRGVAEVLAHEDTEATLISDTIKGLASQVGKSWKSAILGKKLKVSRRSELGIKVSSDLKSKVENFLDLNWDVSSFGIMKADFADYSKFMRLVDKGVADEFVWWKEKPLFNNYISLKNRIGKRDAKNWLFGELSAYMREYNPIASENFTQIIASEVRLYDVPKGSLNLVWGKINSYVLQYMDSTSLVNQLLRW